MVRITDSAGQGGPGTGCYLQNCLDDTKAGDLIVRVSLLSSQRGLAASFPVSTRPLTAIPA